MQQSSFKKEGMQHYMILSCDKKLKDGYQKNLLQFHEVPYILPFDYRIINDEPLLYYRLQYRTTLKSILPHMPLDKSRLYNMLKSIVGVLEAAEDFLLPSEGIIMKTENVFVEADTGRLQFCYMPGREENENPLRELLTEIIQAVNKKDEENVLFLLKFYDLVTEPDCTIKKMKNYLRSKYNDQPVYREKTLLEEFNEEEPIVVKESKEPEGEDKKQKYVMMLLAGLAVINVIFILGLLFNILTYKAARYLFVSMGLLIITAIIYMNMQKEDSPEEIMQAYFDEQKDTFKNKEDYAAADEVVYGETTLLTGESQREEIVIEEEEQHLYLESLEKGKYEPIHIKNSVVLGCMAEGCSYILKERGISRMHAKLMEKADGLYLLDLNSTNGTYLNGQMIESGEDYKIEAGDHIAFAKSEFYVAVEAG